MPASHDALFFASALASQRPLTPLPFTGLENSLNQQDMRKKASRASKEAYTRASYYLL